MASRFKVEASKNSRAPMLPKPRGNGLVGERSAAPSALEEPPAPGAAKVYRYGSAEKW